MSPALDKQLCEKYPGVFGKFTPHCDEYQIRRDKIEKYDARLRHFIIPKAWPDIRRTK